MPTLWEQPYAKNTLLAHISDISALAGLRPFTYTDGRARGMRGIEGWTGSGLRFVLWPDRALDIGPTWFNGKPVAWVHPGLGTPEQYDSHGLGWLRTFGGGLLTSGGLTYFGAPDAFDGKEYGLHGRVAHLPAENVRIWQEWRGEDYVLIVEGEIRQAVMFGENLLLKRRIKTGLGSRTLTVRDTVSNEGSQPTPHGLLYHCNFGFPIVSPDSRLYVEDLNVEPRTPEAEAGLDHHTTFETPTPGYPEQVFFHTPVVDEHGYATASLFNPTVQFGIRLKWLAKTMPILTQWKMMGEREYVCGLEPATYAMAPVAELAKQGLPRQLSPGEHIDYELELTIIENI
jgi:galactose mutarotase-like enzyme